MGWCRCINIARISMKIRREELHQSRYCWNIVVCALPLRRRRCSSSNIGEFWPTKWFGRGELVRTHPAHRRRSSRALQALPWWRRRCQSLDQEGLGRRGTLQQQEQERVDWEGEGGCGICVVCGRREASRMSADARSLGELLRVDLIHPPWFFGGGDFFFELEKRG